MRRPDIHKRHEKEVARDTNGNEAQMATGNQEKRVEKGGNKRGKRRGRIHGGTKKRKRVKKVTKM